MKTSILNQSYLSIRCRSRDDAVAAAAPAAAAVRFLSTCLLLHAVKFTGKGREVLTWRAVAAIGISQHQLKAAIGYDFVDVVNRDNMRAKLKPAGFTVPMLQAWGFRCVGMLGNIFDDGFGFSLADARKAGFTVNMLLEEELLLFPNAKRLEDCPAGMDTLRDIKQNYMQPALSLLSHFVDAGYAEADVRAAVRETKVAIFEQRGGRYYCIAE